jgi:transposase
VQLKTILNHVQRHRSFVYGDAVQVTNQAGETELEIPIKPRANGRPRCSGCGSSSPGYDTQSERRFEFVPLWGIAVFFCYAMRRVDCGRCGVRVEQVPWADGKRRITTTYAWFLAQWAKKLSWTDVAKSFRTSWETVFRAVEMAVTWGREHVVLDAVRSIGVDEILWHRGHKYLTVVYQIDDYCKRILWVGEKRTTKTILRFFRWFGPDRSAALKFVASDMWKPYLRVIAKKAAKAVHVLDPFHMRCT